MYPGRLRARSVVCCSHECPYHGGQIPRAAEPTPEQIRARAEAIRKLREREDYDPNNLSVLLRNQPEFKD